MMAMALNDTIVNPLVPPLNPHTYSTFGHDYSHHPWEKPNYATFDYPVVSHTVGTASSSSAVTSKASNSHSSFATPSTTHPHLTSNFYRRHTELALPTTNSSYSTTTAHPPPSNLFAYTHAPAPYHPSGLFFGWNNGPSLVRTHSASYEDYSPPTMLPHYTPVNSSSSQPSTSAKPAEAWSAAHPLTRSMTGPVNSPYPSFLHAMPPIHFSLPPLPPAARVVPTKSKSAMPSTKRRSRVSARVRYEILKLKANQPTIFVWEIQQTLLQTGICTGQTLPNALAIQRILSEPVTSSSVVKDEPLLHADLPTPTVLQKIENQPAASVTICLSPCQSDNECTSECSICLETYRSGQEVSILSCAHEYHSACIKEWMIKNRSCPMCRKDIHNQPQFVTLLI